MKVQAIVPTAGQGTRLPSYVPKPLIYLKKKPIFIYALEVFEKSSLIDGIVLVVHRDYISEYKELVKKFKIKKIFKIIEGGATRAESVYKGVMAAGDETEFVLIHDGVRPYVTAQMIKESVSVCKKFGAAVIAVRSSRR